MKKFACSSSITWCDLYFAPIIFSAEFAQGPPQFLKFQNHNSSDFCAEINESSFKILGRRCAWGVTACFEQTQQIKAANRNLLRRRSFSGGLLGTHARRGATVPPSHAMTVLNSALRRHVNKQGIARGQSKFWAGNDMFDPIYFL